MYHIIIVEERFYLLCGIDQDAEAIEFKSSLYDFK